MFDTKSNSGVSPVIGIILMVAVTVGLVALASTIVFDLGSNVNEPADVSSNLEFDEATDEVIAEVVRNENAQSVSLRLQDQSGNSRSVEIASGEGETGTLRVNISKVSDDDGNPKFNGTDKIATDGVAEVVANVGETKNQQVIATTEYEV